MEYPSVILENAVNEFSKLPGVGKKTALRLVLYLLRQKPEVPVGIGSALIDLQNINYCKVCHNISDTDVCALCADPRRDGSIVCVVENIKELMAVENTMQYRGLYHVLGGIISPMEGVGPADGGGHGEQIRTDLHTPEEQRLLLLQPRAVDHHGVEEMAREPPAGPVDVAHVRGQLSELRVARPAALRRPGDAQRLVAFALPVRGKSPAARQAARHRRHRVGVSGGFGDTGCGSPPLRSGNLRAVRNFSQKVTICV